MGQLHFKGTRQYIILILQTMAYLKMKQEQ